MAPQDVFFFYFTFCNHKIFKKNKEFFLSQNLLQSFWNILFKKKICDKIFGLRIFFVILKFFFFCQCYLFFQSNFRVVMDFVYCLKKCIKNEFFYFFIFFFVKKLFFWDDIVILEF